MKRLLIVFLFISISFSSFSQAMLGYTAYDIKMNFSSNVFTDGVTDYGDKYISTFFKRALVGYYFNAEGYTDRIIIIPSSQGNLNYYVESYNSRYVIISSTKWTAYSDGGIMNIELIFPDDGTSPYFFIN